MINLREKYKVYIWSILGAIVLFFLYILISNIIAGEKGRVKKFILKGARAVESKNILTCSNMISMDYHDKYGNDKHSLLYITKQVFGYYEKIFVRIDDLEIKLEGSKKEAQVQILALVVGQTKQDAKEKILEGEKGRFKVKLIKEDKKWRLLELEFYESVNIMGQQIS